MFPFIFTIYYFKIISFSHVPARCISALHKSSVSHPLACNYREVGPRPPLERTPAPYTGDWGRILSERRCLGVAEEEELKSLDEQSYKKRYTVKPLYIGPEIMFKPSNFYGPEFNFVLLFLVKINLSKLKAPPNWTFSLNPVLSGIEGFSCIYTEKPCIRTWVIKLL